MADAAAKSAKMTGAELGGRLFALELAFEGFAKLIISHSALSFPAIDLNAFETNLNAKADDVLKSIGHPEATAAAKSAIADLIASIKQ